MGSEWLPDFRSEASGHEPPAGGGRWRAVPPAPPAAWASRPAGPPAPPLCSSAGSAAGGQSRPPQPRNLQCHGSFDSGLLLVICCVHAYTKFVEYSWSYSIFINMELFSIFCKSTSFVTFTGIIIDKMKGSVLWQGSDTVFSGTRRLFCKKWKERHKISWDSRFKYKYMNMHWRSEHIYMYVWILNAILPITLVSRVHIILSLPTMALPFCTLMCVVHDEKG